MQTGVKAPGTPTWAGHRPSYSKERLVIGDVPVAKKIEICRLTIMFFPVVSANLTVGFPCKSFRATLGSLVPGWICAFVRLAAVWWARRAMRESTYAIAERVGGGDVRWTERVQICEFPVRVCVIAKRGLTEHHGPLRLHLSRAK